MMENIMKKYNVILNEQFGYRMLDPVPSEEELNKFYSQNYYELMKDSDTQSMDRFIKDENIERDEELMWLQKTEYEDAYLIFNEYFNKGKLIDIGCGTGEFLNYMKEKGYDTFGIEPSQTAYEKSRDKGLNVYSCSLSQFSTNNEKFDIINMTNVLEHIPEPAKVIGSCRKMLNKNGIVRIKVPNDFNELQLELVKKLNKNEYWIAAPDHINYFNFKSLINILKFYGFRIINKTVDFPMELFLLMGEDYQENSAVGKTCHTKRKKLELSLSNNLRRRLYNSFSQIGLGRNLIIYGILE